jgi:hypothetical protein
MTSSLQRALVGEAIRTFALVFVRAGAALGALACQFVRGEPARPAELTVGEPARTLEKERV